MSKNICMAVLFVAWLSGCATFSPEELRSLDYGPYPTHYKEIIQSNLNSKLKDPGSAVVEYRAGPAQVWQKGFGFIGKDYGWGVCLWINAKNSFGGYVGRRPYAYLIREGQIVKAYGEMETNMFDTGLAQGMCQQLRAAS